MPAPRKWGMLGWVQRLPVILILAGLAATGAFANTLSPYTAQRSKTLCYCRCDNKKQKPECIKMCELPKYENRWWATSCHKASPMPAHRGPESRPHSPKDSGIENARR